MTYEDHIDAAKIFLFAEELLSKPVMGMAAAEMVWGAAIQVIDAISHRTGTRHAGSNRDRNLIIEYLSTKYDLVELAPGFVATIRLHNHFYTGRLSNQELVRYLATGLPFVNRMMELAEQEVSEI